LKQGFKSDLKVHNTRKRKLVYLPINRGTESMIAENGFQFISLNQLPYETEIIIIHRFALQKNILPFTNE